MEVAANYLERWLQGLEQETATAVPPPLAILQGPLRYRPDLGKDEANLGLAAAYARLPAKPLALAKAKAKALPKGRGRGKGRGEALPAQDVDAAPGPGGRGRGRGKGRGRGRGKGQAKQLGAPDPAHPEVMAGLSGDDVPAHAESSDSTSES